MLKLKRVFRSTVSLCLIELIFLSELNDKKYKFRLAVNFIREAEFLFIPNLTLLLIISCHLLALFVLFPPRLLPPFQFSSFLLATQEALVQRTLRWEVPTRHLMGTVR